MSDIGYPKTYAQRILSRMAYMNNQTALLNMKGDPSFRKKVSFSVITSTSAGGSPTPVRADSGIVAK